MIKRGPTKSIKKHANELKFLEKTVRIPIREDLSRNLNVLDWTFKKTNHLNIGSLKTSIEEEWNKVSKEFILKLCKTPQRVSRRKQSDGEAPVMLELWKMRSTPSLLSLPCPLWLGPIYGSNRTVWHLNWVQTNDLC